MKIIKSRDILGIMQRTLNGIDQRLVNHGKRVSYLVLKALTLRGGFEKKEIQDIGILALLHDIGAYKTEEIDCLVRFESSNVWEHSAYGYLFLREFSPLRQYAPVVLHHHTDYEKLKKVPTISPELPQILNVADRMEIFSSMPRSQNLFDSLRKQEGTKFMPEAVALFEQAEREFHLMRALSTGSFEQEWDDFFQDIALSEEETDAYLNTIVYAIDFRSQHTVAHTITTTNISRELSKTLGQGAEETRKVVYGALLHDLGKIAIPVEILEFPGKLSPQAMRVMQTHVDVTEKILGGSIQEEVARIALRHHEKLNGSGYPRGLRADQLNLSQRIVAVSDIVSALTGSRSYKDKFSKEKTLAILREMKEKGLICPVVTGQMMEHYDEIMENVRGSCAPVLQAYQAVHAEYQELLPFCLSL